MFAEGSSESFGGCFLPHRSSQEVTVLSDKFKQGL
jgi:hypothetical protein